MIVRDSLGLIGQHDKNNPEYLDHGDCPSRTGIMAMCGSEQDMNNMTKLIKEYQLVRHPSQPIHCDPAEMSRDQLIGWSAGLNEAFAKKDIEHYCFASVAAGKHASKWFINKDFLPPDVRLALYRAADDPAPWYIVLLAYMQLPLSILWACYAKPEHELNQIICMLSKYDARWLRVLTKLHPNWVDNLHDYWCGWRDQEEIYTLLVRYVKLRVASI